MNTKMLGTLSKVDLREAWASEAGDFTPWLTQPDNLTLLGRAIGMDLELESQEKGVGPFRADILCKETATDNWVLIENQLERTDHTHLGQLLTYAAGLDAVTIVWIAERFTDEHRAALDWLNEKTEEGIHFFGLELELWRIGDSPLAPKFNVVSKPNEWTRTVKNITDNSEKQQFCWDYWSGVIKEIEPTGILLPIAKPMRSQSTRFDVGWRNFRLKAYFSRAKKNMGVWISCRGPQGLENFLKLQESKNEIEGRFGGPLQWDAYEEKGQGTFADYFQGMDANETGDWTRQHKIIAEKVVALYRAVEPIVLQMESEAESTQDE